MCGIPAGYTAVVAFAVALLIRFSVLAGGDQKRRKVLPAVDEASAGDHRRPWPLFTLLVGLPGRAENQKHRDAFAEDGTAELASSIVKT